MNISSLWFGTRFCMRSSKALDTFHQYNLSMFINKTLLQQISGITPII